MKQKRQQKLLAIISEYDVKTQEELTQRLEEAGFHSTQATVSRDIKEMGVFKLALPDGTYKYAITKGERRESKDDLKLFSKSVSSVKCAMHTVVIRTASGMANGIAATLDAILNHEILGTIAGDDTILIILESQEQAEEMAERLFKLFRRKE